MSHLRSFGRFWWTFVVGDDWRVAAGIAVALAVTAGVVWAGRNPWWLLPLAVVLVLGESLRRGTASSPTASDHEM